MRKPRNSGLFCWINAKILVRLAALLLKYLEFDLRLIGGLHTMIYTSLCDNSTLILTFVPKPTLPENANRKKNCATTYWYALFAILLRKGKYAK